MFKKVLLALMVLSSLSFAKDIDINVQTLIDVVEIKGVEPGVKQDNWVGLYKKGTSVEFKNVIQWAWIKDLTIMFPEEGENSPKKFDMEPLTDGDYIIRVMTRSYQVLGSQEFEKRGRDDGMDNRIGFEMHTSPEDLEKGVFGASIHGIVKEKDENIWIGIFKKGDPVSFINSIQWSWIKNLTVGVNETLEFDMEPLKGGEYIVRVMTKDYQVLASKEFEIIKVRHDAVWFDIHTSAEDYERGIYGAYITGVELGKDQKNWIAIYKKGDSTDFEHCRYWAWAKDLPVHHPQDGPSYRDYDLFEKHMVPSSGKYVIRVMDIDFNIIKESEEFEFEEFNDDNLKVESFDFQEGIGALTMTFNSIYNTGQDNNNWIGIFEKGATSEFKNVIRWAWIRNLRQQNHLARKSALYREFLYGELPNGNYEFRVLTRDYKVIGSAELQVAKQGNVPLQITNAEIIDNGKYLDINFNTEKMNGYPNSNWVAFYPVGSSVDFKNVIHWSWLKDMPYVKASHTKKRLHLAGKVPAGDYEVRVMDRSYKIIDSIRLNVAF